MEFKEKPKPYMEKLKENFGFDAFRPQQLEAIQALEAQNDVFLRKPTGGGKSLIYQYLALEAKIVVLSPLIALMDDQVHQARLFGLAAWAMHSNQRKEEREKSLKAWLKSERGLLFVTPERFGKEDFKEIIQSSLPDYFILDEAHCASQWGHDFRPDYSKVDQIKDCLGKPPTLACTATATPETKNDILELLGFGEKALQLEETVLRKNLVFEVESCFDFEDKKERLMSLLGQAKGPTLIYFSLIKTLEQVSEFLKIDHVVYHSKVPKNERRRGQELFISGEVNLMLATPAFGLGVDKADIRKLIHFELPGSVEAYIQECGRAGRDGKASGCDLLYSQEDIQVQMDFIKWGYPDPETLHWLYKQVLNYGDVGFPQKDLQELKKKLNFYNSYDFRLESALNILVRWEVLRKDKGLIFKGNEDIEKVPDVLSQSNADLIKNQQKKLYDLIQLIRLEDRDDFDSYLKNYFGEV